MAFDPEADLGPDYFLMKNTAVTLFWRCAVLEPKREWLTDHGYQVVRLDASRSALREAFLREIGEALGFPNYHGRSLDAFSEHMHDVIF